MLSKNFVPYFDSSQMRNPNNPPVMQMPLMLARAYVLNQPYTGLFSPDMALKIGTVFPNMYESFPKIR